MRLIAAASALGSDPEDFAERLTEGPALRIVLSAEELMGVSCRTASAESRFGIDPRPEKHAPR
jgi:hypothetical protein